MRPPSLLPRGCRPALLALGLLALAQARAEEMSALPTCRPSVPVPPPEPPGRPEDLTGRPPSAPLAAAPLPPERPTELSAAPPATREAPLPSGDGLSLKIEPGRGQLAPAPLPPERPPELSAAPPQGSDLSTSSSAEMPRCIPDLAAPLPPGRPPELSAHPAAIPDAPLPPMRPPELSPRPETLEETPLPPARPAELSGEAGQKLAVAPADDSECQRRLDALGVTYVKMSPIVNGQCSVANPLSVSALGKGIGIGAPETMTCRLAEGLMRWTAEVQQAADREFGDTLKGFTLGGTYVCRGQNHGAEAQLSEHSFANAVDVMGFSFAKRGPIAVGKLPEGSQEAAFLAAVRTRACDVFTTVLGPGTDDAHGNHLHLDERERRPGSRICQ